MNLYHGTTEEAWKEIQKEGVLWGRKNQCNSSGVRMSRINWLATKLEYAGIYDDRGITNEECVLLEIDMPEVECKYWEYVTYDPIPIKRIRRVDKS